MNQDLKEAMDEMLNGSPDEATAMHPDLMEASQELFPTTKPAATASLMRASNLNPDEELTRRGLAEQLGKPAGLLPPTAQAQAQLRDKQNADALTGAPKLASWLGKPENAAIAVDDVPRLAKMESAIRDIKRPEASLSSMWKSLQSTFAETFISTAAGMHMIAPSRAVDKARDESGLANAELYSPAGSPERVAAEARFAEMSSGAQQKLDIAKGVYKDSQQRAQDDRPEFGTKFGEMTFDAVVGTAISAPLVAAYALPGAGLAFGSAVGFAQTQGNAFGKYAERGATFKEAMLGSGLEGLAEVGLNALPMGYLISKTGGPIGVGSLIKGTLLRELPSEVATYVTQSAIDTAIANPNKTWEDWRNELPEGIAQTMYQATIGSMLMASPHAGIRLLGKKHEDAKQAESNQEILQNLDTMARDSALRNRSAPDFQNFLETLTDETEVQDAYIDAQTLADTLQTPQGQQLARLLPDLEQNVREALASGGDVRMPIAQYAAHISGSELSATLMPATKLSADGLTYAQAQTHYDTLTEQMTEQATAVDAMRVLSKEEFDTREQAEIAAEQPQTNPPVADRRQDPERRRTIDEALAAFATPQEREAYLRKELLTDAMTGLGNRRAYEDVKKSPLQASIDADSLKWINDNMSPDSGDAMLTAIGQALKEVGVEAYHISGDEFMVQGENEADTRAAMDLVQEVLRNATIVVERPDGTIVEKKGVDITYGIGKDKNEADYNLKKEKVSREAAGLRAGRGQEPTGISRRAAERQQDTVSDVAQPKARQTYEEYLAQHPSQEALFEADASKVEATLVEALKKTGRYAAEVGKANAAPVVAYYKTLAKHLGLKTSEVYARYPLKVVSEGTDGYAQGDIGRFSPSTLTISLLRGANLSTFIHESGHFFLESMSDVATRTDAPVEVQKDFDAVLNWFGIKDRATWAALTGEQKRQYHEQWAESYERWTLEGKAPSAELVPVMSRFRSWMLQVYKSMEEFVKRNPASGKLNDDIRGVFSRMLAAESAVQEAEQTSGYAAMLEALVAANPEAKDELNAAAQAATANAVDYVTKKGVADMKWASKARNKILKELQADANAKRAVIREEVTQEVMAEPVNVARQALKDKDSGLKIHTTILRELMPEVDITQLRGMTSAENGTHPDKLADAFGYKSTSELIEALVNAEPINEKIDGLTDQRMLERHGELVDQRALEHAANLAIHNDLRARFMATGLKALVKTQIPASQLAKAAKDAANTIIARKKIRDIKPTAYEAAELKANRNVLKALASSPEAAATAQQSALLNNRLVRSATDALAEVDKGVARMQRLEAKAAQGNMRGEFLEQLNALLERFDLRTSVSLKQIDATKTPLKEWLASYTEEISAVMPDMPEWILNEGAKKHYKDLTVEEFRGLMDTIKGLELLARRAEKQYQAIRDMDFQEERKAVLDRIREYNPDAFTAEGDPKGMSAKFVKKYSDIAAKLGDKFVSQFLNAESIVNLLEGGNFGQLHESLLGRISTRLDWKAKKMGDLYQEVKGLFKAYTLSERHAFSSKEFGKVGNDPITRENAVVIALLHGNAEGRERLANYGWSEAQQQQAIRLLQDKDKALVEGIWAMFDKTLWPELQALNERTRGKAPPKVEPAQFTVDGKTWTGGYFKLKYDNDLDERVQRMFEGDDVKAMMGGGLGMSAKTAQGSSTERKQDVQLRPRLDLGVFSEAVSETVHDLALRESVADTMRLLNDKGVQMAIKNTSGTASYRAIVQRVRDVAARPKDPTGFIEAAATIARKNTVVALMSGLGTAMQNVTGLIPAIHRVGAGRLSMEVAQFWNKKRYEFAYQHSAYLRNRAESYDRSLLDEAKKLTGKSGVLPEISTMLWFMGQTDKLVSVPVWNTAYSEGMATFDNSHDQAVDYADHIVRQTQGSGRDLDVSAIMTGGALRKVFTMFYSYFNAQLAQLVRSGAVNKRLAKENPALAAALFTKDFLLIVAIPAILSKFIFSAPNEEDEDRAYTDRVLEATVRYGMGMFPLVRDVGMYGLQKYFPETFTPYGNSLKLSPVQSAVEGIGKLPGAVYDIATGEGTTKDQKDAIMGVSYAIGLPGKLISNTWTGTQAVMEGESPAAIIYGAPYKPE